MSSHLHHQSRLLDLERSPAHSRTALCLRRLYILLEIISQELTHIRRPLPLPGNGKHFAGGRNIFPYHSSSRRLNLMHAIRSRDGCPQTALHVHLVGLHRCKIATQSRPCRQAGGDDREERAQRQQPAGSSSKPPPQSVGNFQHFSAAAFAVRLSSHPAGLPSRGLPTIPAPGRFRLCCQQFTDKPAVQTSSCLLFLNLEDNMDRVEPRVPPYGHHHATIPTCFLEPPESCTPKSACACVCQRRPFCAWRIAGSL